MFLPPPPSEPLHHRPGLSLDSSSHLPQTPTCVARLEPHGDYLLQLLSFLQLLPPTDQTHNFSFILLKNMDDFEIIIVTPN